MESGLGNGALSVFFFHEVGHLVGEVAVGHGRIRHLVREEQTSVLRRAVASIFYLTPKFKEIFIRDALSCK